MLSNVDPVTRDASCSICGATKVIRKGQLNGRQKWQCSTSRDRAIRGKHGVTRSVAKEMKKDASCHLCGGDYNLAIDHCHATGVLRGILCAYCNTALGSFKDDTDLMGRAIAYLKNPPGIEYEDTR